MYLCSVCEAELMLPVVVCDACLKEHGQCTDEWFVEAIKIEAARRAARANLGESETALSDLDPEEKILVDNILYSY